MFKNTGLMTQIISIKLLQIGTDDKEENQLACFLPFTCIICALCINSDKTDDFIQLIPKNHEYYI